MKKNINSKTIILLGFTLLIFVIYSTSESAKKRHEYMGAEKCMKCHRSDAIGNQYDIWLRSPHAKAFLILRTKNAMDIASKESIPNPSQDRRCLKCHTTGGGRVEHTKTEGVGCEACHGPASGYYGCDGHVDTVNRSAGYEKALKNGMYPIMTIKNIKKREKLCLHCHDKARPCYPTDPDEIYRQTISLQVISNMRKGDLSLQHPLIPPFPQY